jgi:hypothetical protein
MSYDIVFALIPVIYITYHYFTKPKSIESDNLPKIERDHIVTFYFQGNNASRAQASKYTGGKPITYTKDDDRYTAICPQAPLILHNIYEHPELHDVGYNPNYSPWHWICKGITHCENTAKGIQAPAHCFYITRWNVGGATDLDHYLRYFRQMLLETPLDKKIAIFGPSRGASLTLIAMSQLTPEEQSRVSLVIVEAPFDSFPNVLNSWPYLRYLSGMQLYLISRLGLYHPSQLTPIGTIHQIPHTVPIAFITSERDTVVPKACTLNLIERLRETGHPNVWHCELRNSSHDGMTLEDIDDRRQYYEFINGLYDTFC